MFAQQQQQPTTAQLVVFVAINTGVTVLQLLLMPVFKAIFGLLNIHSGQILLEGEDVLATEAVRRAVNGPHLVEAIVPALG